MRALAAIKRSDQRLHDAHGAVVGARIAPSFQIVRIVHMPVAEFGGFVLIEPEMNAQRKLRILKCVGETEVCGRVVSRIAAKDDQHVNFAATHVGNQFFQRFGLIDGIGIDRVGVENRVTDIAQALRSWREQAREHGRLMVADNDDAGAAMALKSRSQCLEEFRLSSPYPMARDCLPSIRQQWRQQIARSHRPQASRWSAFAPVALGLLSTTYIRFILPLSGLRRLAKSRA